MTTELETKLPTMRELFKEQRDQGRFWDRLVAVALLVIIPVQFAIGYFDVSTLPAGWWWVAGVMALVTGIIEGLVALGSLLVDFLFAWWYWSRAR